MTQDAPTVPPAPAATEPAPGAAAEAGLAHVATASFLAARIAPSAGFAVALAGGVALARAAQRAGARIGYGASAAAMLQTVAIMGPLRFGIPLTQAISAPMLGRLHARRTGVPAQLAACAAIRLVHQIVTTGLYIWVILGGLEAYAGTYDNLLGRLPLLPDGTTAALVATGAGLVLWTVFASTVQVLVYRRALLDWPEGAGPAPAGAAAAPRTGPPPRPRFDPRAVVAAAAVGFAVLVASTDWIVLAAIAAWLAVAWATARGDREPVRAGLALTAVLAGGVLVFGLVGGVGLDLTLRRTARAALLVLVATWLRAAAGEDGLREVARRALRRVRRVPATREAAVILDLLGERGSLAASGRALLDAVRDVPDKPAPMAAAVLRWIAAEAARFAPPATAARAALRTRTADGALVGLAVLAAASVAVSLA